MSSHRVVWSRLMGRKLYSVGVICTLLLACPACHSGSGVFRSRWVSDFGTAERHHRRAGGSMLICYSSSDAGRPNPMLEAAEDSAVMDATEGFVRCKLFRTHEPDRRYMAQFGVDRAPAAVVVYEDGTYRAHTGLLSAGALVTFLESEDGPRASPLVSRHIHREADFAWHKDLESAQEASRQTGRAMLVVYHDWLGRDWSELESMLGRHEVYSQVAGMVHCRRRVMWRAAKDEMARWGVVALPAVVIVTTDGVHHVLESPDSYETVARFVRRSRASRATALDTSSVTSPARAEP